MKTIKFKILALLIFSVFTLGCQPEARRPTVSPSASPSLTPTNTQEPTATATSTPTSTITPSLTPSFTNTPAPTLSSTPTLQCQASGPFQGIGVSRPTVQTPYEDLSIEFEAPTDEQGFVVVRGELVILVPLDETIVQVMLRGEADQLQQAAIRVVIPSYLALTPESGGRQHGKVLFLLQKLMDAVFPDWDNSNSWLDENLRSFDSEQGSVASRSIVREGCKITLGVELLEEPEPGAISTSLNIEPDY